MARAAFGNPEDRSKERVVEFDENDCASYTVTHRRDAKGELTTEVTLVLVGEGALTLAGRDGYFRRTYRAEGLL